MTLDVYFGRQVVSADACGDKGHLIEAAEIKDALHRVLWLLTKKVLEGAPSYGSRDRIDWDDEKWGRRVHDYYGIAPYF